MGDRNFSMREDDHRNVFQRHKRRFLLLNGERKMLALEFGGPGNNDTTPGHDMLSSLKLQRSKNIEWNNFDAFRLIDLDLEILSDRKVLSFQTSA